jgi:hypothetical protein
MPNLLFSASIYWCLGRESNPHSLKDRGILSPLRLPIPPPRHITIYGKLYGFPRSVPAKFFIDFIPVMERNRKRLFDSCQPSIGIFVLLMEIYGILCQCDAIITGIIFYERHG